MSRSIRYNYVIGDFKFTAKDLGLQDLSADEFKKVVLYYYPADTKIEYKESVLSQIKKVISVDDKYSYDDTSALDKQECLTNTFGVNPNEEVIINGDYLLSGNIYLGTTYKTSLTINGKSVLLNDIVVGSKEEILFCLFQEIYQICFSFYL